MDEDIQVLKILSDTADNIYLTKRSNIARIQSSGFTDDAKNTLHENIIGPLDEALKYITTQIFQSLNKIPIYNFFLSSVVFDINCQKYRDKYPRRSEKHIENLARRMVVKRFLKNLYFSWNKINDF